MTLQQRKMQYMQGALWQYAMCVLISSQRRGGNPQSIWSRCKCRLALAAAAAAPFAWWQLHRGTLNEDKDDDKDDDKDNNNDSNNDNDNDKCRLALTATPLELPKFLNYLNYVCF